MSVVPGLGEGITLHHGDCLDVLPSLPGNLADSCVTDPPYGLANLKPKVVIEALAAWLGGDRAFTPGGAGFMGRAWDRFVPPPAAWDECYRVLKPGGWLLAFAAPRTADLMGLSIRLAGFSLTDSLHWVTGQGFPKAKSRLKPAHEPVIMARKPAGTDSPLPGLDACRVAHGADVDLDAVQRQQHRHDGDENWRMRPGHEQPMYSSAGRWPPNLLLVHDARCEPAGTRKVRGCGGPKKTDNGDSSMFGLGQPGHVYGEHGLETVAVWSCTDSCPVAGMDAQSGVLTSWGSKTNREVVTQNQVLGDMSMSPRRVGPQNQHMDTGGASRFFPQFTWDPEYDLPFMYCAKAPKSERPHVEGVRPHCAIKPLSVMKWLAKLVTPPGGTILDPFAGTGTTGQAAIMEGFQAILIEEDPGAIKQIQARMARPMQTELRGA